MKEREQRERAESLRQQLDAHKEVCILHTLLWAFSIKSYDSSRSGFGMARNMSEGE